MTKILKGSSNGYKITEQSDKHVVYDLQSKPKQYTVKQFHALFGVE